MRLQNELGHLRDLTVKKNLRRDKVNTTPHK
jgi:hypothetical protein